MNDSGRKIALLLSALIGFTLIFLYYYNPTPKDTGIDVGENQNSSWLEGGFNNQAPKKESLVEKKWTNRDTDTKSRSGSSERDKIFFKQLYADLIAHGFDSIYKQLLSGEINLSALSLETQIKVSRMCLSKSDTEQLTLLMERGLLKLEQGDLFHFMSIPDKVVVGKLDKKQKENLAAQNREHEKQIIEKMKVLQQHGFHLEETVKVRNSVENAFDRAINGNMPLLVEYLHENGLNPTSPEKIWNKVINPFSSGGDLSMAKKLLELGYTPSAEELSKLDNPTLKKAKPELIKLLMPYR